MSANQEAASSGPAGDVPEKSVDKLSLKAVPSPSQRAIQCQAPVPSPGVVKGIPSLYPDPTSLHHPNIVLKGKNDIFSMAAHLPSLQLVTELPDSMKGGAKGYVVVRVLGRGYWSIGEAFFSKLLIGSDMRGHVVEWVEKASFVRLNKLFEITAAERQYVTLLTARNLMAVVREPCERCNRRTLRNAEHSLSIGRGGKRREPCGRLLGKNGPSSPPTGAPTKKKKKTSNKGKEVKLSTPPKEFVRPPITYENEVTIKEPENPLPPSISSGPGHVAGLNHSGPSLSAAARLALLAEEAASINTPGSPHPDADAAEVVCAEVSPLMATPMEEMGAENQNLPSGGSSLLALVSMKGPASRRSSSARNLKFGLIGRLQDRF
ncbi:hypothetical protein CK203_018595 [Vitis vinifera]|uniref:Uncharacterized protein n=1 Tax=Vitis vinifera TaxID=29760 RepID=A0A438J658_VITVI|nr:hypothetical protein CK203_018595 [Vitis vinifera]